MPDPRLRLYTLISDLKTFIPFPAGLITFQPGGCFWPPGQTQLMATEPLARRRGCHTSNKANYAIQPTRRYIDHAQDCTLLRWLV